MLAAAYHWRWIGSETSLKEVKSAISGAGPSTGAMLRSQSPALIAQEHAAWVTATGLARAVARAAAAVAAPAGKGKRACQPVHPRQISFTAARRAIITTTRTGAATASLPAPAITASRVRVLACLARRRIDADRHRHRDRKTKARLGFPSGGPRIPAQTAIARYYSCCFSVCDRAAAQRGWWLEARWLHAVTSFRPSRVRWRGLAGGRRSGASGRGPGGVCAMRTSGGRRRGGRGR